MFIVSDFFIWISRNFSLHFVLLNMLAILLLIYMSRDSLSKTFSGLTKKDFLALAAIFFLALMLRLFGDSCVTTSAKLWGHVDVAERFFPSKQLPLDEISYPKGYASLLWVVFILSGKSFATIFWLNVLASALTAILVFFITYVLSRHKTTAYLASLFYATFPLSIHFTQHSTEMIVSVFLLSLAALFILISLERTNTLTLALSFSSIVLAISFRLENILLLGCFIVACFIFLKKSDMRKIVISAAIGFILSLSLIGFFIRAPQSFGFNEAAVHDPLCRAAECFIRKFFPNAKPGLITLDFFALNLSTLLNFFINESFFPLAILIFLPFAVGFWLKHNNKTVFFFLWLLGFFLGFSLFWATWFVGYKLYMLQLTIPLSVLAALGVKFLYDFVTQKTSFKKNTKHLRLVFIVLLALLFLRMFIYSDVYVKKSECFFDELNKAKAFVGDDCIAVDDVDLDIKTPAKRIFKYFFPKNRVTTEPECKQFTYFKLKDRFFIPIEKNPLMEFFAQRCEFNRVYNSGYFEAFKVYCS